MKKKQLLVLFILAAFLFVLSGCGEDETIYLEDYIDSGVKNPGTTPTDPGETPTDPGTTPTDPGTTPTDPGTTPTDPGTTPTDPGTTPTDPGEAVYNQYCKTCHSTKDQLPVFSASSFHHPFDLGFTLTADQLTALETWRNSN
ncbi:hypothetical protein [Seleniivibrio woodruffii]|uniref:hypothetical protein n=1 Tax=Seleniivibrio woodruffii TaxID=1078050 RepID=UPI0039E544BD